MVCSYYIILDYYYIYIYIYIHITYIGEAQMGMGQMGRQLFSKWRRVSSIWGLAWDVSAFPGCICSGGCTGNSGGPGTRHVPGLVPGQSSWARSMGPAHGPWPKGSGPWALSMGMAHGSWPAMGQCFPTMGVAAPQRFCRK